MFLRFAAVILACTFAAAAAGQDFFATPAEKAGALLTPESVRRAIEGAVDYLRGSQNPDGSWEGYPGYEPGATALVLLSLLSAGLEPDDPTVAKGLERLRAFPNDIRQWQTYPISLQTMVLCQAEPEKDRVLIQRNVNWLVARQFRTANVYRGGWSYTGDVPENSRTDNSNSQFATLALYEAERAGFAIPAETWDFMRDYWTRMQNDDGSWGYTPKRGRKNDERVTGSSSGTGSMTCAGIAALKIAGNVQPTGAARLSNGRVLCCQPVDDELDRRVDHGLQWLEAHFSVRNNPGTDVGADTWLFYYLYGLERVGRLTSHRFIGSNDWYREGADFLLRRKGQLNNYWKAGIDLNRINPLSTAFALLFLSKGRWPVLISKMQYGGSGETSGAASDGTPDAAPWNLHPDELARLTEFVEKRWKRNLIWQVIDSSKATADDYLQTPVLYLSGRVSPLPSAPDERRRLVEALRGYLEQGGFILAEALDGDKSFRTGFFELMEEIFPDEPSGGLKLLPEDHPIWNLEATVAPEQLRPLYGIDFGCRTSVIFIAENEPAAEGEPMSVADVRPSLSCLWELSGNPFRERPFPQEVREQIDAAFGIGLNILAYATGRDLKFKEETPEKLPGEGEARFGGGLYTAILDHGGGSRCAPRAIPNLMKRVADDFGIPVKTDVDRVRASSPDLFSYPILFLHGRNRLDFSDAEIENLRLYFERGGFLFANAICAGVPFRESLQAELARVFPENELKPIPPDDPLFSNRYGGFAIEKLDMRKPQRLDGKKTRTVVAPEPPELYGIEKEGRWIVVVSPYDVSCALERHGSVECVGYTTESALKLSINILLYAVEHL